VTEPTYVYKKGEGWVYQTCEVREFQRDYFKVTVEQRPPSAGEGYMIERHYLHINAFVDFLKRNYNWRYQIQLEGPYRGKDLGDRILNWDHPPRELRTDETIYTIKIERV